MPTARNADVEIYYETTGNPSLPPLLIINGTGSQLVSLPMSWRDAFVDAGFFVVQYDNRDVGLSSKLPDEQYTLDDMAADGIAVLDALGIEKAHVHGSSMGGMIAQQLALNHPERVLTLTLAMTTTGDPDVGMTSQQVIDLFFLPPPTDRESFVERQVLLHETWGTKRDRDPERIAEHAREMFDRSFYPQGAHGQVHAILASGSRTEALQRLALPTLVLHGDQDTVIDISGGRRLAEMIPGARFVVLEGMGHDFPPSYMAQWVGLVAAHASSC